MMDISDICFSIIFICEKIIESSIFGGSSQYSMLYFLKENTVLRNINAK